MFKMEIRRPDIIPKVWGHEECIADFPKQGYCGKKLHLKEGYRCSIHRHTKDETFYIQSGKVYLEKENSEEKTEHVILFPGDIVDIFDSARHRFSGLEDSIIVEFSTPDTESERKVESGAIPDFENWRRRIIHQYG